MQTPRHIAIIMDGNGRWAKSRRHGRIFGHVRGAKVARQIIEHAAQSGLQCLTLFAFSSENWSRPVSEISFLMKLLAKQLRREIPTLIKNNIRFRVIGAIENLPDVAREVVQRAVSETASNTGMNLFFALSYGGRQEIAQAARAIALEVRRGELDVESINESTFAKHLQIPDMPDPDLVIRTSGEWRLSNFLLWQLAYSEILILEKHWPDFSKQDFDSAIVAFHKRDRRFGRIKDFDVSPS